MGIKSLLGFGQARDKPVRNYSNGEYSFNFGQSTSGKSVNEIRNIDKGLSDGLECIHWLRTEGENLTNAIESSDIGNKTLCLQAFCLQKNFSWI